MPNQERLGRSKGGVQMAASQKKANAVKHQSHELPLLHAPLLVVLRTALLWL